jgi:hypothetical protein
MVFCELPVPDGEKILPEALDKPTGQGYYNDVVSNC